MGIGVRQSAAKPPTSTMAAAPAVKKYRSNLTAERLIPTARRLKTADRHIERKSATHRSPCATESGKRRLRLALQVHPAPDGRLSELSPWDSLPRATSG